MDKIVMLSLSLILSSTGAVVKDFIYYGSASKDAIWALCRDLLQGGSVIVLRLSEGKKLHEQDFKEIIEDVIEATGEKKDAK